MVGVVVNFGQERAVNGGPSLKAVRSGNLEIERLKSQFLHLRS
jgi:hypothetical protein